MHPEGEHLTTLGSRFPPTSSRFWSNGKKREPGERGRATARRGRRDPGGRWPAGGRGGRGRARGGRGRGGPRAPAAGPGGGALAGAAPPARGERRARRPRGTERQAGREGWSADGRRAAQLPWALTDPLLSANFLGGAELPGWLCVSSATMKGRAGFGERVRGRGASGADFLCAEPRGTPGAWFVRAPWGRPRFRSRVPPET